MTAPFISVDDFAADWRPLSTSERQWATILLVAAADWIRDKNPLIADDNPAAIVVSVDVVKTAIITGEYGGHTQFHQVAGPYQQAGMLVSPGQLVFTNAHKELLGILGRAPDYAFGDYCDPWVGRPFGDYCL